MTDAGTYRRFGLGVAANVLGRVNTAAIQLASVPVFLTFWDLTLYGEWLLLATVPAYLAMSDLGFTNAAANEMTVKEAAGERAKALEAFQAAWLLVAAVFLGAGGMLLAALWSLPFEDWLNLSRLDHETAFFVLAALFAKLALTQQTGLLMAGYRAAGRYPLGTLLHNGVVLAQFLAVIAVVASGGGAPAAAAADATVTAIAFAGMRLHLLRAVPWIQFRGAWGSRHAVARLVRPSFAFFGVTMAYALTLQGASTLLGVIIGPHAVVAFNTVRTLTRLPQQFIEVISNSVWPEFSIAFGRGDDDLMRRLHRQVMALNIWGTLILAALVLTVGEWIYQHWTRGEVDWDPVLVVMLLLVVWISSLHFASVVAVISINRQELIAGPFLLIAVVTLVAAYGLVEVYGVAGMALALAGEGLARAVVAFAAARHVLEDPPNQLFKYAVGEFWLDVWRLMRRKGVALKAGGDS
ncbi:MAG: hypothetical protein HOL85_21705 [Rhodospirillaceae bacterium]|nr:hypothetical protein [Rhodospirillaceae bacterium]MBT6136182.1 hypothetical protein [Rhodospirillaceae bacterium]